MEAEKTITVSFAQNREDIILKAFFPRGYKGFYVDIGAGHPVVASVTKRLYEDGWHGINVEPNAKMFKLLQADRKRDTNLQVGIADKPGRLDFRLYDDAYYGLSTFSPDMKRQYERDKDQPMSGYKDAKVEVLTLKQLLSTYAPETVDVLKLDVEGFEYEVLSGGDWQTFRPTILCVESNHVVKDWRPLLEKARYTLVFDDGLNEYYVAHEHEKAVRAEFSYPDKVLLETEIIDFRWQQEREKLQAANQQQGRKIAELEDRVDQLGHDVGMLRNANREQEDTINHLTGYILEKARLKSLIKDLVLKVDKIVTLRLTKKLKNKKRYPVIPIDNSVSDPALILAAVRQSDKQVFLAKPGVFGRLEKLGYTILYVCYQGFRKVGYRSARFIKHVVFG